METTLPPDVWETMGDKLCSVSDALAAPSGPSFLAASIHCPPILIEQVFASTGPHDTWVWTAGTDGVFSSKTVRVLSAPAATNQGAQPWASIWDHVVPIKWSVHVWRLALGCIPTYEVIATCGIPLCSMCCCRPAQVEDHLHLFFLSHIAKESVGRPL